MISDELIIVFARNPVKGKVKTRLAIKVGVQKAFDIYFKLLEITNSSLDRSRLSHVYFTEESNCSIFENSDSFIQEGEDLGEKMKNAFQNGFKLGYKKIVLIGSDLPDISEKLIEDAFKLLDSNDYVFGPAIDGGYYLIGMNQFNSLPFDNKQWSTSLLYAITKKELVESNYLIGELTPLNDIDTYEDYVNSSIFPV